MPTLFVFLFKVNVALLIFCAGYYLVLRHLTFYSLNRVYLITAIIFASIYPKIDLTAFAQRHENIALPVQTVILNWQVPVTKPLAEPQYWQWITYIFWAGAMLLGIRLLVQLFSLLKLHRKSTSANVLNHEVRLISGEAAPFSFWRSIYVNPANHSAADLKSILLHEQVHVNGWHTVDILLAELSSIFYWFNPGVWLMKKAVRENIEFITDRKILANGADTKAYQYSLVNVSFNNTTPGIVNHFNISTIKKRIIMMNAKRSSRVNLTRYAFIVPAVALLLVFSFSNAAVVKKTSAQAYTAISTTIADNLNAVMPTASTESTTEATPLAGTLNDDGNMLFYLNGIKVDGDKVHFADDTESIYFLNAKDAKRFFDAGDGKHKVAYAFTNDSPEGKAIKNRLEQLIAENRVKRDQLAPEAVTKLNTRVAAIETEHLDLKANFTSTPNKENYSALVPDTNHKTSFTISTNNISLLDSLNYVLNGKKITIDEFNKIDPNKIIAVNIVSAETAKTMLNDYDNMGFKPHSKILFVTTNDSEKGKKLLDLMGDGNRVTNIRINKRPMIATNSGDVYTLSTDTAVVVRGYGKSDGLTYTVNGRANVAFKRAAGDSLKLTYVEPGNLKYVTGVQVYGQKRSADMASAKSLQTRMAYTISPVNRISDKLIIIDGKEASEKELKKLSAFDIDRMSTASDADTIKKYGDKAKYGVVYIYTKKGK